MTRRSAAIAALLAAGIVLQAAVGAQAPRFTSRAVAVRVDALVTDGKRLVTGLTAADFELRDAGVVQEVKQIDVEQLPLNLVLAFDTSLSVAGPRMAALLEAARRIIGSLREPDRVALLSFATRVRLLAPLTADRRHVAAALDQLSAHGATSLRDAVFSALALRHEDDARTLVLVFSDGGDTSSWLTSPKVIEAAKRTDAVVYAVGVGQAGSVVGYSVGPFSRAPTLVSREETTQEVGEFLRKVTAETGGRALFASTDADLRATFARTLDEFRNRYVLSYTPAGVAPTGWHTLDVRLKSRKGKVTARRGYFAEPVSSPR